MRLCFGKMTAHKRMQKQSLKMENIALCIKNSDKKVQKIFHTLIYKLFILKWWKIFFGMTVAKAHTADNIIGCFSNIHTVLISYRYGFSWTQRSVSLHVRIFNNVKLVLQPMTLVSL